MSYLDAVVPAFVGNIPVLLAWLFGIALAVRMIRRGGGRAEYLLLIGCSLMFISRVVGLFVAGFLLWLVIEKGWSRAYVGGLASVFPAILSMAAIVCLIYAFWTRWKTARTT